MKLKNLKRRGCLLIALVVIGEFAGPKMVKAQVDFTVGINIRSPSDFYSPLAPYGGWVDVNRYGRCWRPGPLPPDWQPYTVGQWEWTDAGWYWASDEPWSWACYHYGQWILDPVYGWVWVPGTQWAPAWVVWRESPDYIGWAPCGPGGAVFAATPFIFVDVHHFHDRLDRRELVINDSRIMGRSRLVGGFRTETRDWDGSRRSIAVNRGPDVAPIERATGTRFVQKPVRELARQAPSRSPNVATTRDSEARSRGQRLPPQTEGRQPKIYRDAAPAQPAQTGRQEPRIYREPPAQAQPRGREQVSPQPRPERGRPESPVPRREERPPRGAEPRPPAPEPVPQHGNDGHGRDHDGQ